MPSGNQRSHNMGDALGSVMRGAGSALGQAFSRNLKSPHASASARNRSNFYSPQLLAALGLIAYGALVIWTASFNIAEASFPRHLVGIVLGIAMAIYLWRYDYRVLANETRVLFVAAVVLMLLPLVPGLGYSAKGATGWVKVPLIGITFQPSEFAKLVTIYLMAGLGAEYNGRIDSFRDYLKLCGILTVPFMLILLQPDLGTGLIVLVVGAAIIICSGARREWVIATIVLIVLFATVVVVTSMSPNFPHLLKTYQLNRLIVFVDPSVDPAGDGYNLQQAKIAVGSGGLLGKGIGNASQAGSGFLPEAHTDFVFALLSEEFGFVGAVLMLGLFAVLIFSTIALANRVDAPFGKLVLVGCATMWSFQLLQNVGMCIGLMPITGIPLPFISYGSTSMMTQIAAVGMVQSVWYHIPKTA